MVFDELKKNFTKDILVRDFIVTLVSVVGGLFISLIFDYLSKIPDKGGDLYYLARNAGLLFLAAGLMVAYVAIHRGNSHPGTLTVRSLLADAAGKTHLILLVLIGSLSAIFVIALAELVFSLFGYIPYAGPVIVALLALPLFAVNTAAITAVVLAWVVVPPMLAEDLELKRLPAAFLALVRKRGLIIIGYTITAMIAAAAMSGMVLLIIHYAAGITKAVEWNINAAIPQAFKSFLKPSYISDIIDKIAPRTDPMAALREYGSGLFNYIEMLGAILFIAYGTVILGIISFILSLFFKVLSYFYIMVKKGVLD